MLRIFDLSIPIPKAIVATITMFSEAINLSCTAVRASFVIPAWYPWALNPTLFKLAVTVSVCCMKRQNSTLATEASYVHHVFERRLWKVLCAFLGMFSMLAPSHSQIRRTEQGDASCYVISILNVLAHIRQCNLLRAICRSAEYTRRVYVEGGTYILCNLRSSLHIVSDLPAAEDATKLRETPTVAVKHRTLSAWTSFANLATWTKHGQ